MNDAVALDDLARAMSRRGAPMTAESALFILLQAVEAMREQRMVLDVGGVEIDGEGVVRLNELCSPAIDDRETQEGIASVLEASLEVPSPVASELVLRLRGDTTFTRAALAAEIGAALVPLNRGAAQRMLGRLVREHYRPAREKAEEALRAAPADDPAESMRIAPDVLPPPPEAVVSDLAESLRADRTVPDARVHVEWDLPAKKEPPSALKALVALGLAMVLLGAAAVFLWGRLHR